MHPLLGDGIPSPISTKIFHSTLRLRNMRDHQIGRHTIFSEACYIEMCLAAGLATMGDITNGHSSQTRALKIENLKLGQLFSLLESKTYQLHTIANISVRKNVVDWGNVRMEIFQSELVKESEPLTWFSLASGTVTSTLTADEISPAFDATLFKVTTKRPGLKDFPLQMYDRMASRGLKFGPAFQLFNEAWWNGTDGNILLKVHIPPEKHSTQAQYIINPLLLEAMIQAMMMINLVTNESNRFAIAKKIEKFIWLHQPNLETSEYYVSACINYRDARKFNGSALLVNSAGEVSGVMSSVEFTYTTVKTIDSVLDQKCNPMAPLWNEVWVPQLESLPLIEKITNNDKFWLWFPEDNSFQLSSYLMEKVKALTSKRIVVVKEANQFEEQLEECIITIRRDKEEDFCKLFKCILSREMDLEGIFYGWALNNQGNVKQEKILRPYFYLTKSLVNSGFQCYPRLFTVTQGAIPFVEANLSNFPTSTIWGHAKALKNEFMEMSIKILDVESGTLSEKQLEEVHVELWNEDKQVAVVYRKGTRFRPKFQRFVPSNKFLHVPHGCDRFKLAIPQQYSTTDVKFELDNIFPVRENEVEVQTKAFSLNSNYAIKNKISLITNFSGVVNRVGKSAMKFKVGDRVYGCNIDSKKMPSHVIVEQDFLFHLSPNFSFCEGATICAEYLTAIICLIQTAQIKSDDVVLIHNASEGVGLSAIEICRDVGCKIIATASCTRQQNYLRLKGIHHVFSLKDTEFATNIMNATNGKGVDVVLNFLNGEYLKNASLKICVKGASFVEISNIHLWKPEQVQQQGTDVKYFEVDLDNIFAKCDVKNKGLFDSLKALISRKVVKPNPYTRFDAINLEEALNYLEKGEYIGNVVCVMPEWKFENGNVKVHTPLFNDCITYLITGGLGSLGFTFCKWMLEEGAKYIVLASRNPPNQQQRKEINELNLDGKHVVAVKLDVGNLSQCKALVQTQIEEMGFPPLRGVMHTALALENGPITNQNWERWGPSLDSKIYGPLNLHEATKTLNLEHFVVFSSIASQFGIPFCCNYVAGNYFSDSLAHFRHSLGLPGTTVNWSQWGEVGVSCHMDVPGFKVLSTLQALNGFDNMLRTNQVQLAVANFESFPLFNICFPLTRSYVDEKEWNASGGTDDIGTKSDVIFEQLKKSLIANNKKDRYVED